MTTVRLPNVLIAGVTKAGTTSLFAYLVQHPDVCGSSRKETEYFSDLLYPDRGLGPRRDYEAYFRHCGDERYVVEATPNYWYGGPRLIDATETVLDEPRYIVSLRDPVDRFWSEFTYMKSKALLPAALTVAEFLERCQMVRAAGTEFTPENRYFRTLSTGYYGEHLPALIDRLGERLRIVFFEGLVADPFAVVESLSHWLGLDAAPVHGFDFAAQNTTVAVRSMTMQKALRRAGGLADRVTHRRPHVKDTLVRTFGRVNRGGARRASLDEGTRGELRALYSEANRALRTNLAAAGYVELPDWLGVA